MKKPTPKFELIIGQLVFIPDLLSIEAVTEDARIWIDREAPPFGQLIWIKQDFPRTGSLSVSSAYDPFEVVQYLLSYNEDEDD